MARNESKAIMGYLPIEAKHHDTIISLVATATLLIQRGDLAHVKQFHYKGYLPDVMNAICESNEVLGVLTDNPPVVSDPPAEKPESKPKKGKSRRLKDQWYIMYFS